MTRKCPENDNPNVYVIHELTEVLFFHNYSLQRVFVKNAINK